MRASEVIFDSEVHFVSEVSPDGEVMGKLNFTWCIKVAKQLCTNFTASQLHFRDSENFTTPAVHIIQRSKSTNLLVSERVEIAPRAFCEKQNKVRSTASEEAKLAKSIYFPAALWYNTTNR